MRALLSAVAGGPETLTLAELPDPVPGPGQLAVAVRACAIGHHDVLRIADPHRPHPFVPGGEIAGVVAAVGAGVTGWAPGDRVIGAIGQGGMAEQVVVDAGCLHRLPDGCSFAEGAALVLTHGAAIHALLDRGRLTEGNTLLVLGAAGGVGLAAVALGRAFGARVVAVVSSDDKARAATQAGADLVIVQSRPPFDPRALAGRLRAAVGPGGADVIFDPVGGPHAEPALRAIAWQGRYLAVGFAAGVPGVPLDLVLASGCDVCGVAWAAFAAREPEANRVHVEHLFRLWQGGRIAPRVASRSSLDRAGTAVAQAAAGTAIGRPVVEIG